jgi:hypothetical protein
MDDFSNVTTDTTEIRNYKSITTLIVFIVTSKWMRWPC